MRSLIPMRKRLPRTQGSCACLFLFLTFLLVFRERERTGEGERVLRLFNLLPLGIGSTKASKEFQITGAHHLPTT